MEVVKCVELDVGYASYNKLWIWFPFGMNLVFQSILGMVLSSLENVVNYIMAGIVSNCRIL